MTPFKQADYPLVPVLHNVLVVLWCCLLGGVYVRSEQQAEHRLGREGGINVCVQYLGGEGGGATQINTNVSQICQRISSLTLNIPSKKNISHE